MSAPNCNKELFREHDADLIRPEHFTAAGTWDLWRGWPSVPIADVQATLARLATHSSSEESLASHYLVNPQAGQTEWPGTYYNSRVFYDEENKRVVQILSKTFDITSVSDFASLTPLIQRKNDILNPFDLKTGEADQYKFTYKNIRPSAQSACMNISDADLVSDIAGAGWTYVDREFVTNDNGLSDFICIFQKMAWNAFVEGSPDFSWVDNYGTGQDRKHELWIGVSVSDALSNLYASDGDYNVMRVEIDDHHNGSKSVHRVQWKEDSKTGTSSHTIDPHALRSGTMYRYEIFNHDFKTLSEASTSAPGVNYKKVAERPDVNTNGLWDLYLLFEYTSWDAWSSRKSSPDSTETQNYGRHREGLVKTWEGIRNGDLSAAVIGLQEDDGDPGNGSDDDYHVEEVRVRDNRNGSITLVQTLVKELTEDAATDNNLSGLALVLAHDFRYGTLLKKRSVYENFTEDSLASISESAPDDYKLVNQTADIQRNGLFTRVYEYEKMDWREWGKDEAGDAATDPDESDDQRYDAIGHIIRKTWHNVRIADITTAVAALRDDTDGTYGADTGYHIYDVRVTNHRNGAISLHQYQVSKTEELATTGTLGDVLLVNPHDFQNGTLTRKRSVYEHFTQTELDAIEDASPGEDYKLAGNPTEIDRQTGYYTRIYLYEWVAWVAWEDTTSTADITEYGNAGDDNEREVVRKTWIGIQNEDMQSCVSGLRDNNDATYGSEDGFIVTDVHIYNNRNGSFNVTQIQKKQVDGIDVTGTELIHPHAIQEGVRSRTTTFYENFTEDDLPAPDSKVPGTDSGVISNIVLGPDRDGLFKRVIIEESIIWVDWADDPTADLTSYDNAGDDNEREVIRKTWLAVQKSDMTDALAELRDGTGHVGAENGYRIYQVGVRDNRDGSVQLSQDQRKQVDGIDVTGTELIHPHAIQEGVRSRTTTFYENFTEDDLPAPDSKVPGTDSGVISNIVLGPDRDGLFKRVIIEESITWVDWADDPAADLTSYDNAGDDNEREVIRKTWLAVQKSDMTDALAELRDGTGHVGAENGYRIYQVGVRDNRDGSVQLSQSQRKQLDNVDNGSTSEPGRIAVSPHAWDGGYIDFIETHYEGFTQTDLETAIGSEAEPTADYKLARKTPTFQDGLFGMIYRYEKPTFSNEDAGDLSNRRVFSRSNWDEHNDKYGIRAQVTDGGEGVPIAELETVRDNQEADVGHFLTGVQAIDNKDGSGTIRRNQVRARGTINQYARKYQPARGYREATEVVVWNDLSETNAALVYNDATTNEADMSAATYAAAGSGHKLMSIERIPRSGVDSSGDMRMDIIRITSIPKISGFTDDEWIALDVAYTYTIGQTRSRNRDSQWVIENSTFHDYLHVRNHLTAEEAAIACNDGKKGSRIQFLGPRRYRSLVIKRAESGWSVVSVDPIT